VSASTSSRPRQPGAGSLIAAAGVVLLLAAAFIVLQPGGGTCPQPTVSLEVQVAQTGMTPSTLTACRGQEVTLRLTSTIDGIFHVHGLDAVLPATEIAAGDDRTFTFTAEPAGQFPVELHTADSATTLGTFRVDVP
jgi:hypothetical protein